MNAQEALRLTNARRAKDYLIPKIDILIEREARDGNYFATYLVDEWYKDDWEGLAQHYRTLGFEAEFVKRGGAGGGLKLNWKNAGKNVSHADDFVR